MILTLEPEKTALQSSADPSWLYVPGGDNGPVSIERIEKNSAIVSVTWQTRYHFQSYTMGIFHLN